MDLRHPGDDSERTLARLLEIPPLADELGTRLAAAGFTCWLVGGSVRDLLLNSSLTTPDLDFATDATPEQVLSAVEGWADSTWEAGVAFGTVGLARRGVRLEVTTFRSESYEPGSRKPQVGYGDSIDADLSRRDFTINAMAVSVPDHLFVDLYGGLRDLAAGKLRTPVAPHQSFDDDPLRMMRAARFAAQLGFTPIIDVVLAMTEMAGRLEIVSAERVREEFSRLLLSPNPAKGLELLVETGICEFVVPEIPRMRMAMDPIHHHKDVYLHSVAVLKNAIKLEPPPDPDVEESGPDLVLRMAALLHDIGKPDTRRFEDGGRVSFHHHEVVGAKLARKRLKAMRYDKQFVSDVATLVELHLRFHGYGRGEWTDSAVRRYVTDAGPLLERLHRLVRSDCTTRNRSKAAGLAAAYDEFEHRIRHLQEQEDLRAVRPDLSGEDIMRLLGLAPGPLVGKAWRHLKEVRLDRGPLSEEEATAELLAWAQAEGIAPESPQSGQSDQRDHPI